MAKVKQDFLDNLENLQTDYAECKINTEQFEKGLAELGVSTEEIPYEVEAAEDARYEYKLDKAKRKE
jgi:hypothetical protein